MPLSVILPDGTVERPASAAAIPLTRSQASSSAAAQAVATGHEADRLSGSLARDALKLCLAEIASVQTKSAIEI